MTQSPTGSHRNTQARKVKASAIADPRGGTEHTAMPGPSRQEDLSAYNEETMSKYGFPQVNPPDAHVYKDEDGYYVVKEEWRKPTNPFERLKLAKDPMKETIHLAGLESAARASADDFKAWDEQLNDPDEVDHRYKWAGLFHRRKGHYGRYMLRLKIPNGVVTSEQVRHLAGVISSCGEDGCADITTRQNFQLRGIELKDAPEIIKGIADQGLCSLQSGLDNVRNATGNPLAGFDPREIVDTRPITAALQDYVTGGGRGNPDIANLPRKWNVCVVGGPDFYEHPDINDLAFIPAERDGIFGFNMLVGGFISSARAAEAVPLNAWVPESEVVAATHAVITTFRDYGHRGNRQKCRMMWLIDEMGIEKFKAEVASRMPSGELLPAAEKDLIDDSLARRSYIGVHKQKQDGLSWIGVCVPGGRLQAEDMMEMANLAEAYGSGELRLTVEQNFIIPNVPDERVDELLQEPLLSRYTPFPGKVVGSMVACTGKQFCGFAQIETKKQAYTMAEHLESVLDFPNGDLRMIWTGCPNSCAPVQVADIGLMGCQVKNPTGEKGMVDGVNIFVGGTVGPGGHLKEHPEIEKVPCSELATVLEDLCIQRFGAVRKATPTPNPQLASRWKINKSAQYTKGLPKALGKATHICTGCGYIYQETKSFAELPDDFVCPSCSAPKSKFEAMKEGSDLSSSRPKKVYPEDVLVTFRGSGETVELELVSKTVISADTRVFRFSLPTAKHILGLPVGQHVTVSFKNSSGDVVSRPYTPISSDDDVGFVDFCIKIYDDGNMSQKMESLKPGDKMSFDGPHGNVVYSDRGEFTIFDPVSGRFAVRKDVEHLGLIAGGTGVTPMLQLIRQIFKDVGDTTRVSLIYANKTPGDVLLKSDLDELATLHPNFSVHYTVDDASGVTDWNGSVGFVDADMIAKYLPKKADGKTQILMCGPPAMLDNALKPALQNLGFSPEEYTVF